MNSAVYLEAFMVGLLTISIGVVLHYLLLKIYGHHDLNNMLVYIVHLFIIGVTAHLLCEFTGINKWYCTNGAACQ
jgi:hypothetical protein